MAEICSTENPNPKWYVVRKTQDGHADIQNVNILKRLDIRYRLVQWTLAYQSVFKPLTKYRKRLWKCMYITWYFFLLWFCLCVKDWKFYSDDRKLNVESFLNFLITIFVGKLYIYALCRQNYILFSFLFKIDFFLCYDLIHI